MRTFNTYHNMAEVFANNETLNGLMDLQANTAARVKAEHDEVLKVISTSNLLGKQIDVYGSVEEPWFKAKDIAEWLEHTDTTMMLRSIDVDEKGTKNVWTNYGNQRVTMVTEDGLYEILMLSRKPIAKEFKRGVKKILKELRTKGHVETKPMSTAQMLLMQAQLAVEMENRINEQQRQINQVASDVQEIKDIHAEATERLLAAPMSDMEVPAETLRGQINELVRSYARKTGANISDIWQKIYRTLYYRFHINIEGRRKKKSENKLDIAERCNLLDKVFACASQVVREGM